MNPANARHVAASVELPLFARAGMGTALTALSGIAFLFVCMILPLVGKAGVATVHARQNHIAFLVTLLLALGLGIAATYSKLQRRKLDQSPLPHFTLLLTVLNSLLLLALVTGLLKI